MGDQAQLAVQPVGIHVGFNKYQHVERVGTSSVDEIDQGEWHAFPKLDGANGSIWLDPLGHVRCGSRNNVLGIGNTNKGFYEWVQSKRDALYSLLSGVFHGCTLYGEWLVKHTFPHYAPNMWNDFHVFDVMSTKHGLYMPYDFYARHMEAYNISVVKPIESFNGVRITEELVAELCKKQVDGVLSEYGVGEGIVIKNYNFINRYGNVVWAKFITPTFHSLKGSKTPRSLLTGDAVMDKLLTDISEMYITDALVNKTVAKIEHEYEGWTQQRIPMLLGRVYYDFINEELFNALKEFRSPTIDFKRMRSFVNGRIKALRPDLF